jgi:hypothetical protein
VTDIILWDCDCCRGSSSSSSSSSSSGSSSSLSSKSSSSKSSSSKSSSSLSSSSQPSSSSSSMSSSSQPSSSSSSMSSSSKSSSSKSSSSKSSSSKSSSSSSSQGGFTVKCCGNIIIPATLFATITGAGICNGTYQLVNGGPPGNCWDHVGTSFGTCTIGVAGNLIALCCQSSTDAWSLQISFGITTYSPSSVSCYPFDLLFTGVDMTNCGGTVGTIEIT